MAEAQLSIGDVADRTGIPTSTLRYYEQRGVLPRAQRVSGRRMYGSEVFEQLALVDLLGSAGFTLAEVAASAGGMAVDGEQLRQLARTKVPQVERHIEELAIALKVLGHLVACPVEPIDACPSYRTLVATHAQALASTPTKTSLPESAEAAGLPT